MRTVDRMKRVQTIVLGAAAAGLALLPAGCGGMSDAKIAKALLEQKDPDDVQEAILAIGEQNRRKFIPLLIKLLQRDPRTIMRCACAHALGEMRATEAAPALIKAMEDRQALVRCDAAIALGKIASPKAAPRLARTVRFDPDPDVRAAAATALGRIATSPAVQALIETLLDRDASVRYAAARALHEATGRPFSLRYGVWKEYWSRHKGDFPR